MLILENIRLSLSSLRMNKMRSFLTMLGIIIGIGSVIAIMTVSSSLTSSITSSFDEMGASNITVGLQQTDDSDGNLAESDRITDEMLEALKSAFPTQISALSVSESLSSGTIVDGADYANVTVTGINTDYYEANDMTLLAGRRIKEADLTGEKRVIMVSDKVVDNMFDGDLEAALWQEVKVEMSSKYYSYYIVGVYEYDSSTSFSSSSDEDVTTAAYIPLTTAKAQAHSDAGYTQFTVVTTSEVEEVSSFADMVELFFQSYYRENPDYEISTTTMESLTESMNEMINTVSIAIAFIAGISLLVGGIGVMNIMLVSITERTKEIGTRKALGAKNSSIRLQFIIESMVLCLIGGILGILLGVGLGAIAASVLGFSATAPFAAIVIAVGFSMVIGVFFGYYPANKAAKLNPIDALRYE